MTHEPPDAGREEIGRLLALDRYPRAAAYDPLWVLENMMGPNPLWLAESLSQVMPLAPGSRVLDLGCDKAITSIFLAREFGVQVWAADLWITPGQNWARVQAAGLEDRVYPIYAEAHALPFAEGFFDAIVSVDAYHYFGTDDLYLSYCARLLKPGGRIGIVVPGLLQELDGLPPAQLAPYWDADFCTFHSPAWWRGHWQRSGAVEVELAGAVPYGWEDWLQWNAACARAGLGRNSEREANLLRADGGRLLGFSRIRRLSERRIAAPRRARASGSGRGGWGAERLGRVQRGAQHPALGRVVLVAAEAVVLARGVGRHDDAARSEPAQRCHGEQRAGLHLERQHAAPDPALAVLAVLGVQRVVGAD